MIDLKLAKYNEEGKFEKYLELGKDFMFGGFSIHLQYVYIPPMNDEDRINGIIPDMEADFSRWLLDEKDPLNRFNGLFNGRTYGGGMFVLIHDNQDDFKVVCNSPIAPFYDPPSIEQQYESKERIFNIHENPELWSKIK